MIPQSVSSNKMGASIATLSYRKKKIESRAANRGSAASGRGRLQELAPSSGRRVL